MTKPSTPRRPQAASPRSTTALCAGPAEHNRWQLRQDQTLSLVRQPLAPRPLRLSSEGQALEIDLARSALLVVDMQNDFCHPEGWFGQKGLSVRPMRRPIPVLQRLLPAWRQAGARVVWLNWGVRPDRLELSPTVQFKGKHGGPASTPAVGYAEASAIDHGPSVVAGHWGAQVVDELPVAADDISVHKHRLSGFWDNELDTVLRQQGITTLLFAGVNTDRCVFSTLQDAAFLGYDCLLLKEACSTGSPAYVSRAIHFIVQKLHGFVVGVDSLLAALPGADPPRPPARRGRTTPAARRSGSR